jgi:pimeloyl-ACP methyl ester carboxylesterase
MAPHHRFQRVHGVQLHWVERGHSDRRAPLVLLHGLSDCYLTWMHLATRLVDRPVLALDLPGHGLSERPDATYELDWYARVVSQWVSELGLEGFDLVGHSFGGGIAQTLLLRHAERVRRLVLVSSGGLGREVALPLRLASVPRVLEHFGQAFMGAAGTRLTLMAKGHHLSDAELAHLLAMSGQPGSARALGRTIVNVIGLHGQRRNLLTMAHELPTLPPMAVFWGVHDNVIPIAHARQLAHHIEGVVLQEFKNSGHYPHYDEAEAFARALTNFLDVRDVPAARWAAIPGHEATRQTTLRLKGPPTH